MRYSVRDALSALDRLDQHPEFVTGLATGEAQGLRAGKALAATLYDEQGSTEEELLAALAAKPCRKGLRRMGLALGFHSAFYAAIGQEVSDILRIEEEHPD